MYKTNKKHLRCHTLNGRRDCEELIKSLPVFLIHDPHEVIELILLHFISFEVFQVVLLWEITHIMIS